MTQGQHSTSTLVLAAATTFAAGVSLGITFATSKHYATTKSKLISLLNFDSVKANGAAKHGALSTASSSSSLHREEHPVKLAIVVKSDLDTRTTVEHVAWTVLGAFKKLYKRRDPSLKLWETTGSRLLTLTVDNEDDLILVQQGARALGVTTHTFAGKDRMKKERTVMTVGPATEDVLSELTTHLTKVEQNF